MPISQETANQLHPGKRIYVKAWWYKDERAVLCEVISTYYGNRHKAHFSWEPPKNLDDITHVEVKPLEGNCHRRFFGIERIIS